jgi:GT2 family glycosyltransferase
MIYDFVFIVVVYKNTLDLQAFLSSFKISNSKIVVINSFYDEVSKNEFAKICKKYNTDFFSVPNKGYGFGNNYGCNYVLKTYQFRYLIISNADIIIKQLDISMLKDMENCIIAPDIRTLKGKRQNPFLAYHNSIIDKLKYHMFVKFKKKYLILFAIYSRSLRILYHILFALKMTSKIVYSAHGSFVIIDNIAIRKLFPLYNEQMFLFAEEEHLAMQARRNRIQIIYEPGIKILHKEDGSIDMSNITIFQFVGSSYIKFYQYWYKGL